MKTDRCVEYVKIDEEGNKMEVLLNASNENVRVKGERRNRFCHGNLMVTYLERTEP